MIDKLYDFFKDKKILLLGFGLEGQSTLRLLEKLNIADDEAVTVWEKYNHTVGTKLPLEYDIIVKSPGIPLFQRPGETDKRITGQADLFLRFCRERKPVVVGITGTKGKSTTSSLLHHILSECGVKSRLIGNIGVPPLDIAYETDDADVIVAELSCHQLEYVEESPQIAVLLNIYEEHLDHYIDFAHYKYVKENIFRFQRPGDVLIRGEDAEVSEIEREVTNAKLRGRHNLRNIAVAVKAAIAAAELSGSGIDKAAAIKAGCGFGGLEHRLELFAEIDGVAWVNDSICTIPEAAIAAVEAFPEADTIIIGGMDRGVDYSILTRFLQERVELNVIALPDSGHKIAESLSNVYKAVDLADAVAYAKQVSRKCCVLSPAAASYGFYRNFEERGTHFKELVLDLHEN
ncbi:MAG: Mur ligase family protein [Oscillospiraceae bacterium]|nr:Mur ligase family protein [Oscillospiraceae bacterium]